MTSPLARALREHGDALASTIDTLSQLDAERWARPWGRDKWSPAQIVEHLTLVYEDAIRDLQGGEPVRPRVGPGWQKALRMFLLPHILFHRNFPLRARAPREWRPAREASGGDGAGAGGGAPEDAAAAEIVSATDALSDAAERFEDQAALALEEGRQLRHPYFGPVDALRAIRLAAVHLEHHRRQILHCLTRSRATAAAR